MKIIKSGDSDSCEDYCIYDSGHVCNTCFRIKETKYMKQKAEENRKKLEKGNYYWVRVLGSHPYISIVYYDESKYLDGMGTDEGYELSELEILEKVLMYKEKIK